MQAASSDLDSNLARYVGLPKEQVIARLGTPKAERELGDRTILAWTSRTPQYLPTITTLRTTGAYAGEAPIAVLVPAGGGSMNDQGCELRLVMTGAKVERTQWSGNRGLCQSYLRTLERAGARVERTS
jgi:hypothetical protein